MPRRLTVRRSVLVSVGVIGLLDTANFAAISISAPSATNFGATVYDVTVANPSINSGTVATTSSTDNSGAIDAFINYASMHGGGTVKIPNVGNFISNAVTIQTGVDLEVDGTLRAKTAGGSLITSTADNIGLTGSGTIDGAATAKTSNNLISLTSGSRILIQGASSAAHLTVSNAGHEHMVIESDTDVIINNITLKDANTNIANTDGIDFSGKRFVIENSSISDGDDDIVAKPSGSPTSDSHTSDVSIINDIISAGHGISVGGQTPAGLERMNVQSITFNGTDNGLRLKAGNNSGDVKGGGIVKDVSFSNITMTNVDNPILINSWYDGGDDYGSAEASPTTLQNKSNPGDPLVTVNESANTSVGNPFFDNISYSNITSTGTSGNVMIIYGLNSQDSNPAVDPPRNIDNISFSNVKLTGAFGADIYYVSNLNLSGLSVFASNNGSFDANGNFVGTLNGNAATELFGNTLATTPEPGSLVVLGMAGFAMLARRRARCG
jgi:polygalacturonase